jgi:hypothetical protein
MEWIRVAADGGVWSTPKVVEQTYDFSGCGIVSCDVTWYLGDTSAASIFTVNNIYFSDFLVFSAGSSVRF